MGDVIAYRGYNIALTSGQVPDTCCCPMATRMPLHEEPIYFLRWEFDHDGAPVRRADKPSRLVQSIIL